MLRDPLRHFTAEFIGTYALVFIGGGAIMASKGGAPIDLLGIALAHGLILAIMVTATMRISGHLNPAVTAGFLVTRRITPMMAGIYLAAQLLGSIAATYSLKATIPAQLFEAARGGGQFVDLSISSGQAYALEAIATFFLVFVVFGTAVDPDHPRVGGWAIGLTVAAGILAIGPLTGGSMNPARSFGPALVTGIFEGQLIYWIGPIVGGILAALIYEYLFIRRRIEPVDHGPIAPLPPHA